jgi:hypothetical protein
LLLVSFSSNDLIGHVWGPDSPEVLDVTLRTDLLVKELLDYLDEKVGKGMYTFAMCADHGVCPLPEVTAARKKADPNAPLPDAGRLDLDKLHKDAEAFLQEKFGKFSDGKGVWLTRSNENSFYINRRAWQSAIAAEVAIKPWTVETALADWLKKRPGILTAYTRAELEKREKVGALRDPRGTYSWMDVEYGDIRAGDEIGKKVALSFHPKRSGDVIFVLQPYWWVTTERYKTGTGHGTPHDYDTHVPLLVYGPRVRPGVHSEAVTPLAVRPILEQFLNKPQPNTGPTPLTPKLFAD